MVIQVNILLLFLQCSPFRLQCTFLPVHSLILVNQFLKLLSYGALRHFDSINSFHIYCHAFLYSIYINPRRKLLSLCYIVNTHLNFPPYSQMSFVFLSCICVAPPRVMFLLPKEEPIIFLQFGSLGHKFSEFLLHDVEMHVFSFKDVFP